MSKYEKLYSSSGENCFIKKLGIDIDDVMNLPVRYLMLSYSISKIFNGKTRRGEKIVDEFSTIGDFVNAGYEKISDKIMSNFSIADSVEILQVLQEKLAKFGVKLKGSDFVVEDVRISNLDLTSSAKELLKKTNKEFKTIGDIYVYGAERFFDLCDVPSDKVAYNELTSAMMQFGLKPEGSKKLENENRLFVDGSYFTELVRTVKLHYFDKYNIEEKQEQVDLQNSQPEAELKKSIKKTNNSKPRKKKIKNIFNDIELNSSEPKVSEVEPEIHIINEQSANNFDNSANDRPNKKIKINFEISPSYKELTKEEKESLPISVLSITGNMVEVVKIRNCFNNLNIKTIGDLSATSKVVLKNNGLTLYYYEKLKTVLNDIDFSLEPKPLQSEVSINILNSQNKINVVLSDNCNGKAYKQLIKMSTSELIFIGKCKEIYEKILLENGIDTFEKLISYTEKELIDLGMSQKGYLRIAKLLSKHRLYFKRADREIKNISDNSVPLGSKQVIKLSNMTAEEFSKLSTQILNVFGISDRLEELLNGLRQKENIKTIQDLTKFGRFNLQQARVNKRKLMIDEICTLEDILAYFGLKFVDSKSFIRNRTLVRYEKYDIKPFGVAKVLINLLTEANNKPNAEILYPDLIDTNDSFVNTSVGGGVVRVKKADLSKAGNGLVESTAQNEVEQEKTSSGESGKISGSKNDQKFYFNNNGFINKSMLGRVRKHNFGILEQENGFEM